MLCFWSEKMVGLISRIFFDKKIMKEKRENDLSYQLLENSEQIDFEYPSKT